MGKELTKVTYKPDSKSTDEYSMIVNPAEYQKWKEGDRTIPLTEVVDSFEVFYSVQGHQGMLGKASKQQLENEFGSHKDIDVAMILLEKGSAQSSAGFSSGNITKNLMHGDMRMDVRGSGHGTSGTGA